MTARDADPARALMENEVVYRLRDEEGGIDVEIEASGSLSSTETDFAMSVRLGVRLDGAAVLRAELGRDDPAATRVSGSDQAAARARRPLDPATTVAIAFVITGWAIYLLLGPLSLFLTWYGDCLADPCPSPSRIDEAMYVFDVLWWIAFPALIYFAYRGLRWAWAALLAIAIVLDLQIVAAVVGARGFSAFWFTLPAAAVLTFGAGLGLAMTLPRVRDRAGAATAGQLASIGCLAVVVAVVALQGLLIGVSGPILGVLILMAIAMFVIVVAAFANRDVRRSGPRPTKRPPRR